MFVEFDMSELKAELLVLVILPDSHILNKMKHCTVASASQLIFAFLSHFQLNVNAQLCEYNPLQISGQEILPPDAENELQVMYRGIHSYCSLNGNIGWKNGVESGLETSIETASAYDDIDYNLIMCHEGFYTQAYVKLKNGKTFKQSGIKIGAGVDLRHQSVQSFGSMDNWVANSTTQTRLLDIFTDYFGLRKDDAATALCNRNSALNITASEAYEVSIAVIDDYVARVRDRFNTDWYETQNFSTNAENNIKVNYSQWDQLSKGIRTVIASMYYMQVEKLYNKNEQFWKYMIDGEYYEAIDILRTYACLNQFDSPKQRCEELANILEASIPCRSDVDIVFLIDSSYSVDYSDFREGLNFIVDVVETFDDYNIANGIVRVGVAQFSAVYTDEIFMNAYLNTTSNINSKSDLIEDTNRIQKKPGGQRITLLASAMEYVTSQQFTVRLDFYSF